MLRYLKECVGSICIMKAIILAAGRGQRLKCSLPKALLQINGKTILQHQVTGLRDAGIKDIYVVCGYESDQFPDIGANYVHNAEYARTDNSYSLLLALQQIGLDDYVVVLDGDVLFDYRIFNSIEEKSQYFVDTNKQRHRGDVGIKLAGAAIIEIGKHLNYGIGVGIMTFSPILLRALYHYLVRKEAHKTWWIVHLNQMMQDKQNVEISPTFVNYDWVEVDTQEDYDEALKRFDNPKLEFTDYVHMKEVSSMYESLRFQFEGLHLNKRNPERDEIAWKNSNVLAARLNGRVVGLCRYISDGAYYAGIWDVMVRPEYQRKQIGAKVLEATISKIKLECPIKIFLFSTKGKEIFYQKFGFRFAKSPVLEIRND